MYVGAKNCNGIEVSITVLSIYSFLSSSITNICGNIWFKFQVDKLYGLDIIQKIGLD